MRKLRPAGADGASGLEKCVGLFNNLIYINRQPNERRNQWTRAEGHIE